MLRRKPGILSSWEWRRSSIFDSNYCSKQFTIILLVLCSILNSPSKLVLAKNSESRVVCYYTNWSAYRQGPAKFLPDNINPYLCTHLIYAFGGLTSDQGIKPFDKYQDIDKGGYTKFNGLKTYNKALKTLIAIGGWNEGSGRFSRLVADADARKSFIKNSIRFLRQHQFDGLDLDWEYPAARDGGEPEDKKNYAVFIKELREAFEDESRASGRTRLLLTIAVPAGIEWIQKGFDVPTINRNVDFFNLLTYDYHASTEPAANHHAPLKAKDGYSEYDYKSQLNIEYSINYYLEEGADADKLVVGLPTYGRSYTLFNADSFDVGASASGPGIKGKYTKEPGYLSYYEICEGVKSGDWTVENDDSDAQGPHAVKGDQWVGYDDERIMGIKAKWVREKKLGGIMFWSVDNDDFRGFCSGKPFPLIEAAKLAYYTGETVTASSTKLSTKQAAANRNTNNRFATSNTRRTTTPAPPPTTTAGSSSGSGRRKVASKKSTKNGRRRRIKPKATTAGTTTSTPPPVTIDPLRTPPPPTTPDPGVDFECKDDGFFPHPRDCKKYFWCLDAPGLGLVAHHFTCPAGLFFNKNTDSCDYARNVPCKPGGAATTTTSAPTTTTTTTPAPTTKKTTTTTEPEVEYEYYDEEEEEEEPEVKVKVKKPSSGKSAQEIKDIQNLLGIIRKLGGVEELEKYLADNPGVADEVVEYEYEDEEEDKPVEASTQKSTFLSTRNRFTQTSTTSRSKFVASANTKPRSYTSIQRNRNTASVASKETSSEEEPAASTEKKVTPSRPKYVTLSRETKPKSSSTETSVVVRFSNEEKLLDEAEVTEKPRYVTLARSRQTSTLAPTSPTTTQSPNRSEERKADKENSAKEEDVDSGKEQAYEDEYLNTEEEEALLADEAEKATTTSTTTPATTTTTTSGTTAKPARIRIPTRKTSGLPPRSRATSTTTTTTETPTIIADPTTATARRTTSRLNFPLTNRRNLFGKRGTTSTTTTSSPAEYSGDESISEAVIQRAPVNNRRRRPSSTSTTTGAPDPSTPRYRSSGSRRPRTTTTTVSPLNDILYTNEIREPTRRTTTTTTTLNPFTGSFQSAVIRRRTRKPTTIISSTTQPTTTTTSTTTTRPTTTTTSTSKPSVYSSTYANPKANKIVQIPNSNDYYYYYYDDEDPNEDLLDKSQSQSAPAAAQFLRRSLDLDGSSSSSTPAARVPPPPAYGAGKNALKTLIPLSEKVKVRPNGSIECLDKGIYPHPASCRQYINCAQNEDGVGLRGWVYSCPKQLTFDPIGGMCNWASNPKDTATCTD